MAVEILGSQLILSYEWTIEDVEKATTVLSRLILFQGEKVFRVCLQNTTTTRNATLIFLVANLNKLGLRVQQVTYGKECMESSQRMKESEVKKVKDSGESLQLFTVDLIETPIGNRTFCFSICIVGSVPLYSYHLSDRLAKEQLWSASLKSQHHVDVEFVVKNNKFSAHKAILAARSLVFAEEFIKEKPGRKDDDGPLQIIRIDDVEAESFEQFLHFLYTGEAIKLANEELLKLAERYHLNTLIHLCRAALTNIDVQQMMSCMSHLNPEASTMHKETTFPTESIHIRPNKKMEVLHDAAISVFQCHWETAVDESALKPNVIIEYQNEKLFAPHLTGKLLFSRSLKIENPWIHLICVNHRNFGLKIARVFCSTDYCRTWTEMKSRRAENVELFLFVAQANETFYTCNVHFRIEMTSTIENNHYEMMDTCWTTQLWQAALDQQLTDVEIFVGPIKMEAHRVVLSARSPVLSVLLDNATHVKPSIAIEKDMDADVVKHFLKFLYTGYLEMSATNKQLLELAEMYEVKTLMTICQLANCISPDVKSKLDALPSKIDVSDKPSVTFQMDLDVVKHFLTFLNEGSLDSTVNIRQLTALAEMYQMETLTKICQFNNSVSLDEVTTFLLTPF